MPATDELPADGFYVLVTGSNSGLGLGISTRLIDEFLHTRPQSQTLVLISTTRDSRKAAATTAALEAHLRDACRVAERRLPGIMMVLQRRVQFRSELLDLNSLVSVKQLGQKLRRELPRLDVLICNAGIGGWTGVNWGKAIWLVCTDMVNATTWPSYRIEGKGWVTKPQLPSNEDGTPREEPPLGEVFCANVFGHYVLGHEVMPLLSAPTQGAPGRIIWLSSIDAAGEHYDHADLQGIKSTHAYERSKRLTDVLAMTADMPSTSRYSDSYFEASKEEKGSVRPRFYLSHPGVVATGIFPLPWILLQAMAASFWIARWLGSMWHCITPYKGATSPVWLALADQSMLDNMEAREGKGKWGSATDALGRERVERTEVCGWGWGGKVGEVSRGRKGRARFAKNLTKEAREEFEEVGQMCWKEMEKLRLEWEGRLEKAGVS